MGNKESHWLTGSVEQRRVQTSKGPVEYADVGQGIPVLYFHRNDAVNDAAVLLEARRKISPLFFLAALRRRPLGSPTRHRDRKKANALSAKDLRANNCWRKLRNLGP